jgi:hypothetical protein
MKRISGGQLSREAKPRFYQVTPAVLRTAAGDTSFTGQAEAVDTAVASQPAASPKDLPVGSDVTVQTADHFGSDSSLAVAHQTADHEIEAGTAPTLPVQA